MQKFTVYALAVPFLLVGCIDTTGISPESSKPPKGNPAAAVLVEEFGDLQCPACKAAQEQTVAPLLAQHGSQIRFEWRQFPLHAMHPYALSAAMASECAADQGKFWEFVDLAFVNQTELNIEALSDWALELGLDMDLFDRCLRSGIKKDAVRADYNEGKDRGATGTPTFYVNGEQVDANAAALSAAINAAAGQVNQRL